MSPLPVAYFIIEILSLNIVDDRDCPMGAFEVIISSFANPCEGE